MTNEELADKLYDIADMLEIEGVQWEPRAYRTAALTVLSLGADISDVYKQGKLMELEGIGKSIGGSIEEYIKTGHIEKWDKLKKKYNIDFSTFRKMRGLGPKRLYVLYKKLGIKDVNDLKKALEKQEIRELSGFGKKSEEEIKKNLDFFLQTDVSRKLLGLVIEYAEKLRDDLAKSGLFEKVEIAGSTRRMKETVGDLDILCVSDNPKAGMDYFTKMKQVKDIIVKGDKKTSVDLDAGLSCDLRIVEKEEFGAALQYFTGNKEHNVKLRKIAISKGLKLNEYGVFKGKTRIAGKSEAEVYKILGLEIMPPEMRENMGEIEASLSHTLPKIIEYNEVVGDLHVHTNDSDGADGLEAMVAAAEKAGLSYIAVTNHSQNLRVANGLDEDRFRVLNKKIDKLNEKSNVKILKGVELEILKDGSLDLPSGLLKNMDFVLGALHQNLNMGGEELTDRLIKAINTGLITSVAHPTDRLINQRSPLPLNFDKVFDACEKNDTLLEIDGFPDRSDLPFDMVKEAKEQGIRFSLGSDSHRVDHFKFLRLATAIARRGWLEKKNVVNALKYSDILKLRR
jgi:DNA polymerase (family 10)